jgi:hypothetical protein
MLVQADAVTADDLVAALARIWRATVYTGARAQP